MISFSKSKHAYLSKFFLCKKKQTLCYYYHYCQNKKDPFFFGRRTGPEALAHKHMCRSSSTFWNPAETQIMAVPVTDSFEPQAMEHVIFSLSYKRTVKFATLFLLGYFSP